MLDWGGDVTWVDWTVIAVCVLAFWVLVGCLAATLFRAEPGARRLRPRKEKPARIDLASEKFPARRPARAHIDADTGGGVDQPGCG